MDFLLRPMEATDGPAIDALMRTEALTTAMSLTTHYRHDLYAALLAQHPTTYGVVATTPGIEGLVGVATAFTNTIQVGGRPLPCSHLENLKVHHDMRRQGLGGRLAAWRIDEARRRFGGDGVITTGIDATNAASLATAGRWATQVLGPVQVVVARVLAKASTRHDLRIRPPSSDDLVPIALATNTFYEGYDLYPPLTPDSLGALLAPTPLGPIRQYRLAVDHVGNVVAGALVTERFRLMEEHIERVPRPFALVSRVVPLIPRDRVIRTIELSYAWFAPDRLEAGRAVWDAIRFEWRDRATHVGGNADPRGSLTDMFHIGRTVVPRIDLMAPVQSSYRFDEQRPICLWR